MFDVAPTELLVCAVIALVVIGPKDLPKAMRVVGHWVGRARAVARQFRSGFEAMVRESELEEMEKKWREENERIMRAYPAADHAAQDQSAAEMMPLPQPPVAPAPEPDDQPALGKPAA